jgi:hypothetical protein
MSAIYRKLRESAKTNGVATTSRALIEEVNGGAVNPARLSIRKLAEAFMGEGWAEHLDRYNRTGQVLESVEGVDPSAFAAITGQLLVNEVREKYKLASMVADSLCSTIAVTNGNLGPQRVPYLSDVTNDSDIVEPGMPYSQTRFSGQYIDHPAVVKKGKIVAVTAEAIYSDLTSQIIDSARSVGTRVALGREEDILKVVLGITNPHSWNGTAYSTYLSSGSNWINTVTGFTLTDWTGLNTLEQLFVKMKDPVTSKPIMIEPKQVFVMPAQKYNLRRIINATEVESGNYATSGNPSRTTGANPLDQNYEILTSPHAFNLLTDAAIGNVSEANANARVYLGDFKRAFVWREAKPLSVIEAPPQNAAEFNNDIVLSVKASLWGVAGVAEPRAVALGKE